MNNQGTQAIVNRQRPVRRPYAAPEDFCAIFNEDMNALYSLAFLLTTDQQKAEECFLAALEECRHGTEVFLDWARSWSRRAVIKQAIRVVHPRPDAVGVPPQPAYEAAELEDIPRRLLCLPPFERFVFGMAVLERYSDRECASLLECHPRYVEQARLRSLQFVGGSARLMPVPSISLAQEPLLVANIGGNV